MTETERVLDLLIHDLRSPLGVAHGYLRLVRERRLGSDEAHDRALAETQGALARMGQLCDAVAAFRAQGQDESKDRVDAVELARRVGDRMRDEGFPMVEAAVPAGTTMQIGASLDRLADAVATVLEATSRTAARDTITVQVQADGSELCFTARAVPAAASVPVLPFDPWRGYGLAVPLACKLIGGFGGRVWGSAGDAGALRRPFPWRRLPNDRTARHR